MGKVVEQLIELHDGKVPSPSKPTQVYRLGKEPRIYATRNQHSWENVQAILSGTGMATYKQLIDACANHNHPADGRGFIEYCIKNEWLEDVTAA